MPVSQYRPPPPFRGKHVAILGKVSPLFSFSVFKCRLGEVVFLGTIKGVLHSGIDSSWSLHTKKKLSYIFNAIYCRRQCFCYVFLSVSIRLSTCYVLCPFFILFSTFLHLVWKSRSREQNQKCCLTCADVSYHTDRVWVGGLVACGSFKLLFFSYTMPWRRTFSNPMATRITVY